MTNTPNTSPEARSNRSENATTPPGNTSPRGSESTTNPSETAPVTPGELTAWLPDSPDPIVFEDVSKNYGSITAVQGVSLTIQPGEFHCLAGPNGSGKTTLGRIAVGLTRPSSGVIHGPTDQIGYGFQSPRFYPSLTVQENLATFCRATGVSPSNDWVTEVTDSLRLSRVSHQPAVELSGGFQKKLDLAIALVETPAYVWLDEPLGDLDDVSVSRVIALLEAYVEAGGGVAVSTHNFDVFEGSFTHLTVFLDGEQRETMELPEETDTALVDHYRDGLSALYDSDHQPD